jgi:hypothetical protein
MFPDPPKKPPNQHFCPLDLLLRCRNLLALAPPFRAGCHRLRAQYRAAISASYIVAIGDGCATPKATIVRRHSWQLGFRVNSFHWFNRIAPSATNSSRHASSNGRSSQ